MGASSLLFSLLVLDALEAYAALVGLGSGVESVIGGWLARFTAAFVAAGGLVLLVLGSHWPPY